MKPLILLLSLLLAEVGMAQIRIHSEILFYENFEHNSLLLPQEMLSLPEVKPSFPNKVFEIKKDRYINAYKLSDSLLNFYFKLDVVNGWTVTQTKYSKAEQKSKEEFINSKQQGSSLCYLGKIKLSAKFDSYLILEYIFRKGEVKYMDLSVRRLYLVNAKNEWIQSVSQIASYFSSEGYVVHTYTVLNKKQKFVLFEKEISSDVELPKGMHQEQRQAKFHFDEFGYLKTL